MPVVFLLGRGLYSSSHTNQARMRNAMNKPQILTLATIVVALAGAATSAVAAEGEQWVPPTGTLTRAEVQAELKQPSASSEIVQLGEATQFAVVPATRGKLAAVAPAANATRVIQLGEATVFVDAPGTRSREDVRAEARAAHGSSRGDKSYSGS
jgi:hypothetical protein